MNEDSNNGAQQPWGFSQSYGPAQTYGAPYQQPVPAPQPRSVQTTGKPTNRMTAVLVASAMSAVIGAGAGVGSYALVSQSPGVVGGVSVNGAAAPAPVQDGSISAAAAAIEPSVVTIAVRAGRSGGVGSGVVLDTQGYILTNNHVVEAARQGGSVTVTFDNGHTGQATIVGTSPTNDLAVIKVDDAPDLKPATFAKSSSIRVGQSVVAVGAPLGLSESVTSGIVSNSARPVRSGNNGDAVYLAVQTDAAINPGNSGGPLVDLNGAVVGINSSIASTGSGDGTQAGNIGIGFAIPADVAARVAQELIGKGQSTNAVLGVTLDSNANPLATDTGVPLASVESGSPAAQAGLQAGDVVTKVDAFHTTTPDGLIAATRFYAPGTTAEVTYLREGGEHTVPVTMGSS